MIDARGDACAFQVFVREGSYGRAQGFNFSRPGFSVVQLTTLLAETIRTDAPRREQQMDMMVALVAPVAGRMDSSHARDAVTIDEQAGDISSQRFTLVR